MKTKLFLLFSLIALFPFTISENHNNVSIKERNGVIITPPIIPIDPPETGVPDRSSSFSDAYELNLFGEISEDFQNGNDVDYYKFSPTQTNYVNFNIERALTVYGYICEIEIYKLPSLFTPILRYNNADTVDGLNIENAPYFYAEKDMVYYIKVSQTSSNMMNYSPNHNGPEVISSYYIASITPSNFTDYEPEQFLDAGFIDGMDYTWNGTGEVFVYFDESTFSRTNNTHSYSYKEIAKEAMGIWNQLGQICFYETYTIAEANIVVRIESNPSSIQTAVFRYSVADNKVMSAEIIGNSYLIDNATYSRNLKTFVHEFGHAIGLDHIDLRGSQNVMYSSSCDYPGKIGRDDLAVYRYLWGYEE